MIMFEYTLARSKRKTLAIYIRNGNIDVRAPLNMPKRDIDKFIASKARLIADKLARSKEQLRKREAFAPDYGDTVMLRGVEYPLIAKAGARAGFNGEAFFLPSDLESEQIKSVCVRVYRRLAKIHLTDRVLHFAERMSVEPATVKVNGAKTLWGSCSAKNVLNFSWRLILADDAAVDYVVVHELAHIIEMNHSARFWALVERVLPDYRERRARLKVLRRKLDAEEWE
jgi:predicted metal-dependent hydrolase